MTLPPAPTARGHGLRPRRASPPRQVGDAPTRHASGRSPARVNSAVATISTDGVRAHISLHTTTPEVVVGNRCIAAEAAMHPGARVSGEKGPAVMPRRSSRASVRRDAWQGIAVYAGTSNARPPQSSGSQNPCPGHLMGMAVQCPRRARTPRYGRL